MPIVNFSPVRHWHQRHIRAALQKKHTKEKLLMVCCCVVWCSGCSGNPNRCTFTECIAAAVAGATHNNATRALRDCKRQHVRMYADCTRKVVFVVVVVVVALWAEDDSKRWNEKKMILKWEYTESACNDAKVYSHIQSNEKKKRWVRTFAWWPVFYDFISSFFLFRAINYESFASVQHDLIALFSSDGQKTKIMPNSFMCKKSEIEKKELKSVPTPLPPAYNSHD